MMRTMLIRFVVTCRQLGCEEDDKKCQNEEPVMLSHI
jgi:hypothetical protein